MPNARPPDPPEFSLLTIDPIVIELEVLCGDVSLQTEIEGSVDLEVWQLILGAESIPIDGGKVIKCLEPPHAGMVRLLECDRDYNPHAGL